MFAEELFKRNLDRIKKRKTLFGGDKQDLTMRSRIGFLPISIWKPDWRIVSTLKRIIGDFGQTRPLDSDRSTGLCGTRKAQKSQNARANGNTYRRSLSKHKSPKNKSTKGGPRGLPSSKNKSTGGWHATGGRNGHLSTGMQRDNISIFNPHLALMILSAYCPLKARIYDPFAGGGTRGFAASAMGFSYFGREIRKEEVQRIKEHQQRLKLPFDISCEDAQLLLPKKNAYDFSYTCPPYWNMEVYSDMGGDLSNADTYPEFLQGIKKVLRVTYDGLKPGALAVWVVGNFRTGHELLHFNGDVIRCAKAVGFQLHDELIFWGAAGQAASRCGQFSKNRKAVRVHEYIIVLKKPEANK